MRRIGWRLAVLRGKMQIAYSSENIIKQSTRNVLQKIKKKQPLALRTAVLLSI